MNKEQAQTAEMLQEIKIRAKVALDYAWNCDRTNSGCQVPQVLKVVQKDIPYLLALVESLQRERDNPKPLTGPVTIGQVVNGKIVAVDAERGLVSIKWDSVENWPEWKQRAVDEHITNKMVQESPTTEKVKVCQKCKSIVRYDPYWGAYVCTQCGWCADDDLQPEKAQEA